MVDKSKKDKDSFAASFGEISKYEDKEAKKDYKRGEKIADKLFQEFLEYVDGMSKLTKSGKATDWDNRNPFTTDLKDVQQNWETTIKSMERRVGAVSFDTIDGMQHRAKELMSTKLDVTKLETLLEDLQKSFELNQVAKSKHKENIKVPESVRTRTDLFKHLLQQNRGLAMGEVHTQDEMPRFIAKNMKLAKQEGVDTIYLEYPPDQFKRLNEMSVEELKKEIKTTDWKQDAKDNATHYKIKKSDSSIGTYEMFLAAKESGIKIKNIDERNADNLIGEIMPLRIAVTNHEWAANIEKDRKGKAGKFLVFGGVSHFGNSHDMSNGLVDDALGIPHLTFDHSRTEDKGFSKSKLDGIDFTLNGGSDHKRMSQVIEQLSVDPTKLQAQNSQPDGKTIR